MRFVQTIVQMIVGGLASLVLIMLLYFSMPFLDPTWSSKVQAAEPVSARLVYVTGDYRAYCEQPSGNMVYVAKVSPGAGGAAIFVVQVGCR